jgi:hypothetical protein
MLVGGGKSIIQFSSKFDDLFATIYEDLARSIPKSSIYRILVPASSSNPLKYIFFA